MVRVTKGNIRHRKHKKYLKKARGFRLGRSNVYKQVRVALIKQGKNAFVGRKEKKREFRRLWIERLSAAVRSRGGKYSVFMSNMNKKDILINRKVLSNIAAVFPKVFDEIYEEVNK